MKKLLAVLIASALFVPAMAGSIIFENVDVIGEIQTIGTLSSNFDGNGSARDTSNRVLFGLEAQLVEGVTAKVNFLTYNVWGDQSGKDYFDKIDVVEAYVALENVFNALEVKVGRQFYGDENSAIMYMGPGHYKGRVANQVTFGDGVVATYAGENLLVTGMYFKREEGDTQIPPIAPSKEDDYSTLGLDVKYFLNENIALQGYIYNNNKTTSGAKDEGNNGIYGGKVGYADEGLGLSVEAAKNYFQPAAGAEGWLLKADGSVKLALESADIIARGAYIHSEKGFFSDGNYAPGIFFGGSEVNLFDGNTNHRIINVGADFKFGALADWTFALDYFAKRGGANAGWMGNEFDLMAKYAYNEYVELHAGAAYVMNLNNALEEEAYAAQMGLIVKF